MIQQHPVHFAVRFQNLSAEWVWRVIVDLGDLQRGGIYSGGVTVGAREINRIVWRDLVQVLSGWKLRRFPKGLDPAAAGNPFTAFGFYDALLHLREEILARV